MTHEESSFFEEPAQVAMPPGIDGISLLYESAAGAFRVFVARHHGRKVVLKAIKPGRQADVIALTQLHKEYALGFMVDTPAVCRTLAWHSLPDGIGPAIELEYCDGASLRQLLDEDAAFSPTELEAIVCGTLEALAAIHAAGIVHRDIKPANIVFDRARLTAKVIDFGCADTADYALLKSPAGTPLYTPPQKQEGTPTPVPADDLYALGITLGELARACDNPRRATMLRRFGRELCRGRYATAGHALAAFRKRNAGQAGAWLRSLWWLIPAAAATITAFIYIPRSNEEVPPQPTEVASEDSTTDDKAQASTKDSATDDEAQIEQYTLAAGQLLAKSASGLASDAEEADAEVMRFADSLYRADLMPLYSGKTFTYDSMRTMASDHARRYESALYQRFPSVPPGYDPARRRAILRGRILASLRTYHLRYQ